jgi:hypothetical protein
MDICRGICYGFVTLFQIASSGESRAGDDVPKIIEQGKS